MRYAPVLAAVLGLLLAAPAANAAAKPDRKGARAIAAATRAFVKDVHAQKDAIETGVLRLERDPLCDDAIRHVPLAEGPFGAATALLLTYSIEAQLQPLAGPIARYSKVLDAIRLHDRVLRSGRAVIRRTARLATAIKPAPADICTQLGDWRDRGYPADSAPRIDDPGIDALFAEADTIDTKKLDRAARRLRKLGVSRRIARIFRGDDDSLYDGIDLGDGELHIGDANG
jgi:hypothetical protein